MFRRDGMQPGSGGNVARSVVDMPDRCYVCAESTVEKSGVHEGRHLHLFRLRSQLLNRPCVSVISLYCSHVMFTLADKTRD